MLTDAVATDDGAIRSQSGAAFHKCETILIFARHGGSGIHYIGKDSTGAAKYIIFKSYTFIDRHMVLDADVLADPDSSCDINALAKRGSTANYGSSTNMHPMPDGYIGADAGAIINDGRRMKIGGRMYHKIISTTEDRLFLLQIPTASQQRTSIVARSNPSVQGIVRRLKKIGQSIEASLEIVKLFPHKKRPHEVLIGSGNPSPRYDRINRDLTVNTKGLGRL